MTGWNRFFRMVWPVIGCVVLGMSGMGCMSLLNQYQVRGTLEMSGLTAPVTVRRDEKGMAFIHADNQEDLVFAQGFVTAQDRFFQMHLIRLTIQGRLGELAGKQALDQDKRMRTIGLDRLARQQAAILTPETAALFQSYADGVNAFIQDTPEDLHLAFRLAGIVPEKWDVADSLGLLYFLGYATAANLDTEILVQMLLQTAGYENTLKVLPLNIHPADPLDTGEWKDIPCPARLFPTHPAVPRIAAYLPDRSLRVGSNNWAVSPARSATGKALLCGDTHLDPRVLPGVWYPVGLICPGIRAVGVNIPGIPGMAMGRTAHVALAMTNAYADILDLCLVQPDPDHPGRYLENGQSHPFDTRVEILKIKDPDAPDGFFFHELVVRTTKKGPVVTDLFEGLHSTLPVSLRFAPAKSMDPDIGLLDILTAKTSSELKQVLTQVSMVCLNWVFADDQGHIGFQVSGRVPIRKKGHGTFLLKDDSWQGWIPVHEMPGALDPPAGWVGTCNHKTVPSDYPYYYSSYFAPRYRYDRLSELMAAPEAKTPEQMWQWQRDVLNPMARTLAPVMTRALMQDPETRPLGAILDQWDFQDDPDAVAPILFQSVYLFFAKAVFEDELGEDNTRQLLDTWYFWQERLQRMVLEDRSEWFDDRRTPDRVETLSDLFVRAGIQAKAYLAGRMGPDMTRWQWGRLHTLTLVTPVARDGWIARFLGTGPMPMGGSGETLSRGWYDASNPYAVTHCAALRMVVDFADPDRILAVIPGGVTGRLFHPHHKDQVATFMSGDHGYWWFSDAAISAHTVSTQQLVPGG